METDDLLLLLKLTASSASSTSQTSVVLGSGEDVSIANCSVTAAPLRSPVNRCAPASGLKCWMLSFWGCSQTLEMPEHLWPGKAGAFLAMRERRTASEFQSASKQSCLYFCENFYQLCFGVSSPLLFYIPVNKCASFFFTLILNLYLIFSSTGGVKSGNSSHAYLNQINFVADK